MAFFQADRRPEFLPKRFGLLAMMQVFTEATFTPNIVSTAREICGLVAEIATRKTALFAAEVDFSVTTGFLMML